MGRLFCGHKSGSARVEQSATTTFYSLPTIACKITGLDMSSRFNGPRLVALFEFVCSCALVRPISDRSPATMRGHD